jgi:signal transduction histidine kinase
MGLSIRSSIVESYGGRLGVVLNVARGALFRFTLPVIGENAVRGRQGLSRP